MNEELIKELKELGFIREKSQVPCMSMTIKNIYQAFYSIDGDTFAIYTGLGFTCQLKGTVIFNPSIDQILSKIKEKLNFEFEKNKKSKFQDLFDFFVQEHDVYLTETQMEDIIQAVEINSNKSKEKIKIGGFDINSKSMVKDLLKFIKEWNKNQTTSETHINYNVFEYIPENPKQKQTAKPNKTQRIEELESQNEILNTKLQKIEDMVKDKSLKIDELENKINHNQSLQSIENIMEVFKEIQQLEITLKIQTR